MIPPAESIVLAGRDEEAALRRVGGKPFANTAMSELLRELKIAAVPHGFRSSFRDWAVEETDHPREVAEAALAHKVRSQIEAAYRRSDLFERRRRLMDDWASYLAGGSRRPDRPVVRPDLGSARWPSRQGSLWRERPPPGR